MKTREKVAAGAGAIAICLTFTPGWEGMWATARVDTIGTGHPVTYCYGQTDEFGTVKVGQRFTKQECRELLAKSLPAYLAGIQPCIRVALPDKVMAALLDAAYNAGARAVCRSPMLARMNEGDLEGGCKAFDGWYVHASGRVVQGLINRRSGDSRKGEKQLCLEGVAEANAAEKPVATTAEAPPSLWRRLRTTFTHLLQRG